MAAVESRRLVQETLRVQGALLLVGEEAIDLTRVSRIEVVGAGKAGAGMAAAVEEVLGFALLAAKSVQGWINVPADCVRPLKHIHLHAARPAGVNEPTEEGVVGSEEILKRVSNLGQNDLCICLISGGGSALMPAPAPGLTLSDKLFVTRHLAASGATIQQLNTVRKHLSAIKGGGLARACRAGRLLTLIISDVIGDPLEIIASGPTVPDRSQPYEALAILEQFEADKAGVPQRVFEYLRRRPNQPAARPRSQVINLVIGNNARAIDAAAAEAQRLGYTPSLHYATQPEGQAEEIGRGLAHQLLKMSAAPFGPDCIISGGEPVVTLAPADIRGRGGRNQHLVLAALDELRTRPTPNLCLLSGGTDGEDGPTDAAGALLDLPLLARVRAAQVDTAAHLRRTDAYPVFDHADGLIRTGPTHTNVMDLRIGLVEKPQG